MDREGHAARVAKIIAARERFADYIDRVLADAPPLTDDRLAQMRRIWRAGAR